MEGILDLIQMDDLDIANEGLGEAIKSAAGKIGTAIVNIGKAVARKLKEIAARLARIAGRIGSAVASKDANVRPIIQEVDKAMALYNKGLASAARQTDPGKVKQDFAPVKEACERIDSMIEEIRTSGVTLSDTTAKAAAMAIDTWANKFESMSDNAAKVLDAKAAKNQAYYDNKSSNEKTVDKAYEKGQTAAGQREVSSLVTANYKYVKGALEVASASILALAPTKQENIEKKEMKKNKKNIFKEMNTRIKENKKAEKKAAKDAKKAANESDLVGAVEALIDMVMIGTGMDTSAVENYLTDYDREEIALESEIELLNMELDIDDSDADELFA